MTLEPLLTASPAIQFHVLTVVPAALLGGVMLARKKGTPAHRMIGRVWLVLMVLTALSTFLIHGINMFHGFSPIHILSLVVLVSAFEVIRTARTRNFIRHQRVVKSLYFGAIGIAALFTLWPGRIMHEVVFGQDVAFAGPVQDTGSMAGQAAVGAPIWVWPLLAALIGLGVSRMRDREMLAWRLMLLPAIVLGISVLTSLSGPMTGTAMAALPAGLVAGAAAGWWSMRMTAVRRLPGNRIAVKGEFVSLIAILLIFAARFAMGTLQATAPDMLEMAIPAVVLAGLPAFSAALMASRALAQAGISPLRVTHRRLSGHAKC